MTASTEKERASLSAFIEMAEREGFDTAHQWYDAKGWVFFSPSTADCWRYWQAARRAPAAPVPDVTDAMIEAANEAYCPFGDMELAIQAALAAAPQPPEAKASVSNGTFAAPVQLPEYGIDTANHAGVRVRGYTKQQVRDLLAANGIEVAP